MFGAAQCSRPDIQYVHYAGPTGIGGQTFKFELLRHTTFLKYALFPVGAKGSVLTPAFAPTPHDLAGLRQQECAMLPSSTLFSEVTPMSAPRIGADANQTAMHEMDMVVCATGYAMVVEHRTRKAHHSHLDCRAKS